MAYFFDGAVIMILIVTALTGYCKGFVRYVITMLGTVAAVLVAFLIANMSAENVYNKYFKTQLITSLENAAEQTDLSKLVSNELKNEGVDIDLSDEEIKNVLSGAGTLAENTEKLLVSKGTDLDTAQQKGEELSEYIHSVMPQKLSEKLESNKLGKSLSKAVKFTTEQIDEAVKALSEGGRTGAEYLEKNIFRPIALTFIRLCVFMTVYVLMDSHKAYPASVGSFYPNGRSDSGKPFCRHGAWSLQRRSVSGVDSLYGLHCDKCYREQASQVQQRCF